MQTLYIIAKAGMQPVAFLLRFYTWFSRPAFHWVTEQEGHKSKNDETKTKTDCNTK